MAAKKNSSSSKKNTISKKSSPKSENTKKKVTASAQKAQQEEKKSSTNAFSVITFAVSLLLLVLYVIPGGSAWSFIREKVLFGLFGIASILLIVLLMFIAFMSAKDMLKDKKTKWQIVGWSFLILFVNSFFYLVTNTKDYLIYISFSDQFKDIFDLGFSIKNGGLFGCICASGLTKLCASKVASVFVLLILIFTILMLVTKTTLLNLRDAFKKPIDRISERMNRDEEYEDFTPDYVDNSGIALTPDYDFDSKDKIKPIVIEDEMPFDEDDIFMPDPIDFSSNRRNRQSSSFKPISIDKEEDRFKTQQDKKPAQKKTTARKTVEKKTDNDTKQENNNPFIVSETSYISDKSGKSVIYKFPPLSCLAAPSVDGNLDYTAELNRSGAKLVETLRSFGVETTISEITRGPSVTRYEIQPAPGVKISKITGLSDDIAMNMASSGVRIEAPIPNKAAVGIEIPNKNRSMVSIREIIDSDVYSSANSKLNVALGKDITGNIICADLAKMPHLLIAGTTGSGKSVCLNAMIISLLYNATPDEVKLLMIDPKQVEFTVYNGIPHLLVPVVSEPRKSAGALSWAVTEMLNRYKLFSERNVRDIKGYNKFCEANQGIKKLPQIVIFIDELSDLMMAAPHEIEDSICRLAQMARAAGMHLVIATQRPSVDVITGIIKANIPSRISLSVSSQVDSRTILDTAGAEKLLGNGDMLFSPVGMSKPLRVQGAFLSDNEVEKVVSFIKNQTEYSYDEDIQEKIDSHQIMEKKKAGFEVEEDGDDVDPMLANAIEVVVEAQMASTTLLQKRLKLGYARASRIIDSLEERGIVGPFQGSKPREVLLSKQQYHEMIALSSDGNIDLRPSSDMEDDEFFDEDDDCSEDY